MLEKGISNESLPNWSGDRMSKPRCIGHIWAAVPTSRTDQIGRGNSPGKMCP